MQVKAYAKVNYRLETTGYFDDGYHRLLMVNDRVTGLYDEITINKAYSNDVYFSNPDLNNDEVNFCLKILNYMHEIYHFKNYYDIYIHKNIPMCAGLGGGSSDAACIIKTLCKLEKLDISIPEMISIGLKFGTDIPYCLFDTPAIVSGYGERIYPLDIKKKKKLYVVTYNVESSTRVVYQNSNKIMNPTDNTLLINLFKEENYKELFFNSLEEAAFNCYPKLRQYKFELGKYGNVTMSGSGSSFIIEVTDEKGFKNYIKTYNLKTYLI